MDVVYEGTNSRVLLRGCTSVTCSECKGYVSVVTENYERTKRAARKADCKVAVLCPDCLDEQLRRRPPAITIRDQSTTTAEMN